MTTAVKEEVYGAVNMTANKCVQFQLHLSYDETEATTWSIADSDHIVSQLERELYGITVDEEMRFKKKLSIRLIKFEAWWPEIGIQELWKSIEPHRI